MLLEISLNIFVQNILNIRIDLVSWCFIAIEFYMSYDIYVAIWHTLNIRIDLVSVCFIAIEFYKYMYLL